MTRELDGLNTFISACHKIGETRVDNETKFTVPIIEQKIKEVCKFFFPSPKLRQPFSTKEVVETFEY